MIPGLARHPVFDDDVSGHSFECGKTPHFQLFRSSTSLSYVVSDSVLQETDVRPMQGA